MPILPAVSMLRPNAELLSQLQNGQLLTIDPACMGGLLIVKSFYVDFAGPGAAVGGTVDRQCTAVYVIGTVRFKQCKTSMEREESLYTRMAYAERLSTILNIAMPLRRGCLIVEQLRQWVMPDAVDRIPSALISKLVSVDTTIVNLALQSRKELADDMPTLAIASRTQLATV
jgi:hypothetical protein